MEKTSLLRNGNARAYLKFLKNTGVPFELHASNYTSHFKGDGIDRKFVNSFQSNRVFAGFSKLKSEVSGLPVPDINKDELSYFVHDFRADAEIGDVMNIDLKSAYASILWQDGYIRKPCYNYIIGGTKQERLASVGMLAARKQIFVFRNGKIIGVPKEHVSPTSNFFFHAVKRTAEIMADLKQICGNNYLYTWVDGIYYLPNKAVTRECERYIDYLGFRSSTEQLKKFTVTLKPKKVDVNFLKLSDGKWKPKPFTLPIANTQFKILMIDAIITLSKTPTQ